MVYEPFDLYDDLPRSPRYHDEGCQFFYLCLECPFSFCFEDLAGGQVSTFKNLRNAEIIKRYRAGSGVRELVAAFRLKRSTLFRIVKNSPVRP
jgi:hypothetical protein